MKKIQGLQALPGATSRNIKLKSIVLWKKLDEILPPRALDRRLKEDWVRATEEGLRVSLFLGLIFRGP